MLALGYCLFFFSFVQRMSLDLRQALRQSLSVLHAQISSDGSHAMRMHQLRAQQAEMSSIRFLLSTCLEALNGQALPHDCLFSSPGFIKDSQDVASCDARELHALREEVETELLDVAALPRESRNIIQATLSAETAVTQELEEIETKHADVLEQTLSICSSELCTSLCNFLVDAAAPQLTTEDREKIAEIGVGHVIDIVRCWLVWYTSFEPNKQYPQPLDIPHVVTIECMQNKVVGKYVSALRRSMHLRRQQARIVSSMRRLAAAAKVCDVCMMLRDKVIF